MRTAPEQPPGDDFAAAVVAPVMTPDGSVIAAYDFGGDGPPLLLAHATGFHGRVFGELARHLSGFHCWALDLRAHGLSVAGPGWVGDWAGFVEDVTTVVAELGLDKPYAFGHSGGGSALLLAEEAAPGMFRHLYCYEPAVMPILEPLPASGLNPMSEAARRRRSRFASKRDAYENYASKPPLDALDPTVLRAYVEYGFEDAEDGGVELRCAPADEANVFAHGMSQLTFAGLPRIACPVDLGCGEFADTFGVDVMELIADRVRSGGAPAHVWAFEGLGHFGPLERPDEVARHVGEAFSRY